MSPEVAESRQWLWVMLSLSLMTVVAGGPGTTQHLQDIFTGRCYDYKQIRYKDLLPQVSETCEGLYSKFTSAFSNKDPCTLTMANYQPFINAAKQLLPNDKAMFWSGVKDLAHEFAQSGRRYVTLEDTLIGYLVDSLTWCGKKSAGIDYSSCPSWGDCPVEASEAFWASASKAFAESARGTMVTVMMGTSTKGRPAYRQNSFFGKHELPNLDRKYIKMVHVMLTHPLDKPALEDCHSGSLVTMKKDVEDRGFRFSCEDDNEALLHLLCVDDHKNKACQLSSKTSGNTIEKFFGGKAASKGSIRFWF